VFPIVRQGFGRALTTFKPLVQHAERSVEEKQNRNDDRRPYHPRLKCIQHRRFHLRQFARNAANHVFVVKATRMKHTLTFVTLLLLGATVAEAQKLEKNNPPALSKPVPGTYTHVVKAGKLLFIAGQTGVDAAGKVASPGMKEQLEQVMINLLAALKSQGADFSHVAKTTTFVTSISEFRSPEVAAVRAKYLGANPPANTLVQIQQLADPAYKVEIEAIAVLP
jgi:enamine deaminase RidA (YjgF/YER057c/UK114 family)